MNSQCNTTTPVVIDTSATYQPTATVIITQPVSSTQHFDTHGNYGQKHEDNDDYCDEDEFRVCQCIGKSSFLTNRYQPINFSYVDMRFTMHPLLLRLLVPKTML